MQQWYWTVTLYCNKSNFVSSVDYEITAVQVKVIHLNVWFIGTKASHLYNRCLLGEHSSQLYYTIVESPAEGLLKQYYSGQDKWHALVVLWVLKNQELYTILKIFSQRIKELLNCETSPIWSEDYNVIWFIFVLEKLMDRLYRFLMVHLCNELRQKPSRNSWKQQPAQTG